LRRAHQRSCEIFVRLVGDDVTRQQIALLIALQAAPGASQSQLVQITGIDKGTLNEMLGRMVGRGWISRQRDAADARAWRLHATTAGIALLDERMKKVAAVQEEILAPIPEDLRPAFLRCLYLIAGVEPSRDAPLD